MNGHCASDPRPTLLEVAGVLAEGQVEGFQSRLGVFLGTEQQRQQVQGVNVVPSER